jgi:hypothetical protein
MGLLCAVEDGRRLSSLREAAEASPENPQVHFRIARFSAFRNPAEAERGTGALELQPDLVRRAFRLFFSRPLIREADEVFEDVEQDREC